MKIAFLSHEFPPIGGGGATALDALSKAIAKLGHDVRVLTVGLKPKTETFFDEDGRQIVRLNARRKSVVAPKNLELVFSFLSLWMKGRRWIKDFQPDVKVGFFLFPGGLAAVFLRNVSRAPLVVSARGSDVPGFSTTRWGRWSPLGEMLARIVLRRASLVITNGSYLEGLVRKTVGNHPTRLLKNIPNGVDTALFHPDRNEPPAKLLRLLFVGQLIDRKGISTLLEGFEKCTSLQRSCTLTVVGAGPLWQDSVQRCKIFPQITFVGFKSRDKLPDIYRAHDVLIHLSEAEGVSNVLLEALASGLAVVATRRAVDSSLNLPIQVLEHIDNADGLVSALENFLTDPERLRAEKIRNRRLAAEFDWDMQAKLWIKELNLVRTNSVQH